MTSEEENKKGSANSGKINNFLDFVNNRFGIYLDSIQGFYLNHKELLKNQRMSQRLKLTIEELDRAYIRRSNYPPSPNLEECAQREKHRMTQGQYKANNAPGGLNYRTALEDCLSAIFNYWKEFKKIVLKKGGMPDRQIMPIMVYLKDVRDRLTHHKEYSEKRKIIKDYPLKYLQYTLPSFAIDQNIELASEDLDAIVAELRNWILNF